MSQVSYGDVEHMEPFQCDKKHKQHEYDRRPLDGAAPDILRTARLGIDNFARHSYTVGRAGWLISSVVVRESSVPTVTNW